MESLGQNFENLNPDIGFQPEIIPEGVPDVELVDFFMQHLSAPRPDGISEAYHNAEVGYYKQQAFAALEMLQDDAQRERLQKFLNRE